MWRFRQLWDQDIRRAETELQAARGTGTLEVARRAAGRVIALHGSDQRFLMAQAAMEVERDV